MRILILFFLLVTFVFGAEKSCYSVQLTSVFKTKQSSDELHSNRYDQTCKVMDIGSSVLVRCGCFERFKEANTHLKKYKSRYKDAYVLSTYSSRFNLHNDISVKVAVEEAPLVVVTPVIIHRTEVLDEVIPVAVLDVSDMKEEEKKQLAVKKEKKKSKAKKKKAKKKKKSKNKLKKSKAQQYGYNRYLKKLKSTRAKGKYKHTYKFGAQISYDIAYINEADKSYLDSDFRRIRIYHKGSFLNEKLFYELEYSFTGSSKYKDNYVGYTDKNKMLGVNYRLKAGNIMIPFSLERYTSSKNNMFMERSLTNAYSQGRQLGVELLLNKKFTKSDSSNLFISVFTSSIDERIDKDIIKQGYTLRGTYVHKWRKNHLLSVGGAYFSQDINGDNVSFNETAESYLMQDKYISASIKNVETLTKSNIELLYIYDNYSLQGEYTQINDKDEDNNGEQTDYSLGINWYINDEIKLMLNYIVAEPLGTKLYNGRLHVLQTRMLFAF